MDNLKKEIKEQFGANLMFDSDSEPNRYMFNEKQLDVFIDEVVKKMNYMQSSLLLLCERKDWYSHLTVGKKYTFIGKDDRTYVIIDDKKNFQVIPIYYFKELTK